MKIVAFGASNSKNSINKKLASFAAQLLAAEIEDATIELLDLNDFEMPIYSIDRELESGKPPEAYRFYEILAMADLVIISLAEYNGAYTSAFKNIMDWVSRVKSKFLEGKDVVLLATSTGGRGAATVLELAKKRFPFHGARILGEFSLPRFNENFTTEIIQPELKASFQSLLDSILISWAQDPIHSSSGEAGKAS
jgi:chromate reductase, NAD(P)H dehydrogenase (quinone)